MVRKHYKQLTRTILQREGKLQVNHSWDIVILKKNGWKMDQRFGWWFHPSKPHVKFSLGAALIFETRKNKTKIKICKVCGQGFIPRSIKQCRCHDCSSLKMRVGSFPGVS